jgi:putative intracellular protease/amidase
MAATKQKNDLQIGVLLSFEAQMLDLAGIDLFGMISKEYLETSLPQPVSKLGLDIKIWYIGNTSNVGNQGSDLGSEDIKSPDETGLVRLTAQAKIKTNATLLDPDVQPGSIDILLIPGPDPGQVHEKSTLDFVKSHAKHGTTILIVCTGCFVAAEAGILNRRSASGPRALVPSLRKKYTAVDWDDQRRFVKDITGPGEVWSSGKLILLV